MPKKRSGWVIGAGLVSAAAVLAGSGVAAASVLSPSPSSAAATAATSAAPAPAPTQTGARSGPADGGATGIIESASSSGFTISTWTGIDATVDETSGTKVKGGPAKDLRTGESVLVLGLVDAGSGGTTITAAQVDLQPGGDGGAAAGSKSGVEPFVQGQTGPTKTAGTIPSDYTQGDGTLASGAQAYAAVTAAQAVYPGGIVDRVVELPDGGYEVHNISVAWPHHVFENSHFQVIGAND
jgi:hypothetical protein